MSNNSSFVSSVEKTIPYILEWYRNEDALSNFFADCYEFIYNLEKNDEYREVLYDSLKTFKNKENCVIFVNISKSNYFDSFSVYQTLSWEELCFEFDISFEIKNLTEFAKTIVDKDGISSLSPYDYEKYLVILDWVQTVKYENECIPVVYLFDDQPKLVSTIPTPTIYNKPIKQKKKVVKVLEKDLENDLVKWLDIHGIVVETQTTVGGYRTDIWIPGVCFLELKRGKVTAKDFCQALRYSVETDRKIILVGKNVEKDVIETISMYNNLLDCEKVTFVSWDTVKVYLKGLLGF